MNRPLLEDDTIALRALEPADVEVLYAWENDTRLWRVGRTTTPYSREMLRAYVEGYEADIYTAQQLRLMVVEKSSGRPVGAADLYEFDPVNLRAGVGILIDSSCQGLGYGRRAVVLLGRYCGLRLGLHQLWAVVPADNAPCRSLFASLGYRVTGRFKSWIRDGRSYADAYMYQRLNIAE